MDINDIRKNFLGWQCRIRQIAMREAGGKPSSGMRPKLYLDYEGYFEDQITVLLVRKHADHDASQLRHMFLKTQDPLIRYENVVNFLSANYYHRPSEFSDEVTALFHSSMPLPRVLKARGHCVLAFNQFSAFYRFDCSVRELHTDESAYQATYWHNNHFNRRLPSAIRVLGFKLDWKSCEMRHR